MDWDLHVQARQTVPVAQGTASLVGPPFSSTHTYINKLSSDSDESPPVMYSPDSESVINSSAAPSEWSSCLARILWKGQSLWLERRCVLDPHAAHLPFPRGFPLPRPLPFPFHLFWFTPSPEFLQRHYHHYRQSMYRGRVSWTT